MTELKFVEVLGGIDDELIREACCTSASCRPQHKHWISVFGAMAAAVIVAAGTAVFYHTHRPADLPAAYSEVHNEHPAVIVSRDTNSIAGTTLPDLSAASAAASAVHSDQTEKHPAKTESAAAQEPDTTSAATVTALPESADNPVSTSEVSSTVFSESSRIRQTSSVTSAVTDATAQTTASHPAESSAERTEPLLIPGTAMAVFTNLDADYDTAKELFAHPILPCTDPDFRKYQLGIVSRNGDVYADNSRCISVNYVFSDGLINLTDQDRMSGGSSPALASEYPYCGRSFFVHLPDNPSDNLHIWYSPTGETGICYQGDFSAGSDLTAIMDRILSLEI